MIKIYKKLLVKKVKLTLPGTVQTTQANNFPSAPVFPPTTLMPNPRAVFIHEKHTKIYLFI
jgi:hypothetical protein